MKNAVIYARYSSDKQNEMSIEGQITECKRYAEEKNLTIIGEYVDRAQSATTDKRPNFLRMINDSAHKEFQFILVYQLDRFARNRNDSGYYKKILADNNVRVISAKEQIATDSSGTIQEGMLETFADYFSKQLSEKVTRGMRQRAEKHKYNGGTMTFGYDVDAEGYYIPHKHNAAIVQEIFKRIASGEAIKHIMDDLNERGIRTSRGNAFNRGSFHRMLRSEKYIGTYIYGDMKFPGGMPRLISDEVFSQVQGILDKRTHERRPAAEDFLLTGKLYCGECEHFMIGTSGTSQTKKVHRYYTCANAKNRGGDCAKKNVRKELIEPAVLDICCKALNASMIDAMVEFIAEQNRADQASPELLRLREEIKEAEKRIEKLLDQIEQGLASSRVAERLGMREDELERLQYNLLQETRKQSSITPELTRRFLNNLASGKQLHKLKYRKLFIQLFVDKVFVYDDHFDILLTTAEKIGGVGKTTETALSAALTDPRSQITSPGVPSEK